MAGTEKLVFNDTHTHLTDFESLIWEIIKLPERLNTDHKNYVNPKLRGPAQAGVGQKVYIVSQVFNRSGYRAINDTHTSAD